MEEKFKDFLIWLEQYLKVDKMTWGINYGKCMVNPKTGYCEFWIEYEKGKILWHVKN